MPRADVAGEWLYYAEYRESLPKTTLLLLHGAGGDSFHFPVEIRRMAAAHVIALDLPAHGKSGGRSRASIEQYADAVEGFMQKLNLHEVVGIGHSMGGGILQTLALRHLPWLKKIALIGSGAQLPIAAELAEGVANDFPGTMEKVTQLAYGPHASEHLRRQGKRSLLKTDPRIIENDYNACNDFDLRDRVNEITLPTLIIGGAVDRMLPAPFSDFLHEQIPCSQIEIIPEGGHMMLLEKPAQLAQIIAKFAQDTN
jgi:pimeloyl-ACP methyl ester carboxylesterase